MPQTILIVDDDPDISTPLKECLEAHGYQVTVAGDGLQAIQQACDAQPDIIILDFNMPGGGGTAAYVCLRELKPTLQTPVIFLTGVTLAEVKNSVSLDAHTYFISKPAGLDQLLPVIRQALAEATAGGRAPK
ncbi:MAG: response regulator [Elusimicrobiota bacterium]|jgi:CheY-like chemotaxis protein